MMMHGARLSNGSSGKWDEANSAARFYMRWSFYELFMLSLALLLQSLELCVICWIATNLLPNRLWNCSNWSPLLSRVAYQPSRLCLTCRLGAGSVTIQDSCLR